MVVNKHRIRWIDIAKGIGIILVILGHTVEDSLSRGIIFSFHMPLFFILNSLTSHNCKDCSDYTNQIKKNFKDIIVPVIGLFILRIVIEIITSWRSIEWDSYVSKQINTLVYSSGTDVSVLDTKVPALGMLWFLVVLFESRLLYDYINIKLNNTKLIIVIILCSLTGALFGRYQWLPLSIDLVLVVMPYYYFGKRLKNMDLHKNPLVHCIVNLILWLLYWFVSFIITLSYTELACRRYTLFPLCYLVAISGTLFIVYLSICVEELKLLKPIRFIGENSIYMFYIHLMDYIIEPLWSISSNYYINALVRVIIDIILFTVIIMIKKLSIGFRDKTK